MACIQTEIAGLCLSYDNLPKSVSSLYSIGVSIVGGVALIYIIMGGYIILTSRGNPIALERGRTYIFYAIVGLLLALFGFLFIQIIVFNIFRIPGFG